MLRKTTRNKFVFFVLAIWVLMLALLSQVLLEGVESGYEIHSKYTVASITDEHKTSQIGMKIMILHPFKARAAPATNIN